MADIWPYMAIYGPFMSVYGHIWTIYGHIWPYMAHIWSYMDHIWPYMVHICPFMVHICPYMDHIWTIYATQQRGHSTKSNPQRTLSDDHRLKAGAKRGGYNEPNFSLQTCFVFLINTKRCSRRPSSNRFPFIMRYAYAS